jgi:DNA replication protein DnaC
VLTHPILDQLSQLGLSGMAQAFAELETSDETAALTHSDWLGLLVDRELTHRRDKRLAARLRYARLRQQASVEDVDYRVPRGIDRALFQKLASGEWIDAHDNLILCGPTGVGKSWLACALGHKACRDNRSVLYQRVPSSSPNSRSPAVTAAMPASCAALLASSSSSRRLGPRTARRRCPS